MHVSRKMLIGPLGLVAAAGAIALAGTSENEAPTRHAHRSLGAPDCVVARGSEQQDLDTSDTPETPFRRPAGEKVLVYFENRGAKARYWNMLGQAARIWSRSACVAGVAVAKCPAGANCVRLEQAYDSGDDTDAEFEGDDRGGVRRGGTITVYTKPMDRETDNGALATIVHEAGHAYGLMHRLNPNDVMNAYTSDDTNPIPDSVDFFNLLVIYGTRV